MTTIQSFQRSSDDQGVAEVDADGVSIGSLPNIHGDKPFLIKIQRPQAGRNAMLIYDRQRSFQVFLVRDDDPFAYIAAMQQMSTGWKGLKIYRWAKRTGDLQLSICFDRAPDKDPQW